MREEPGRARLHPHRHTEVHHLGPPARASSGPRAKPEPNRPCTCPAAGSAPERPGSAGRHAQPRAPGRAVKRDEHLRAPCREVADLPVRTGLRLLVGDRIDAALVHSCGPRRRLELVRSREVGEHHRSRGGHLAFAKVPPPARPAAVARLRTGVAAMGHPRRGHRRCLPRPAGDGVRGAGRAAAGRRAVGRPCRPWPCTRSSAPPASCRSARSPPRALMTAAVVAPLAAGNPGRYAELAAALAVLVGLLAVVGWLLRLGFVADLLSAAHPGRLPGRHRRHHDRRAARQGHRRARHRRHAARPSSRRSSPARHDPTGDTVLLAALTLTFLFVVAWRWPRLPGPLLAVLLATLLDRAAPPARPRCRRRRPAVPPGCPPLGLPPLGDYCRPCCCPRSACCWSGYTDNVLTGRAFAIRGGYEHRREPGVPRARRGQRRRRDSSAASR